MHDDPGRTCQIRCEELQQHHESVVAPIGPTAPIAYVELDGCFVHLADGTEGGVGGLQDLGNLLPAVCRTAPVGRASPCATTTLGGAREKALP